MRKAATYCLTGTRVLLCLALLLAPTLGARAECIPLELRVNRVGGTVWIRDDPYSPFTKAEGCIVVLEDPESDKRIAQMTTDASGRFHFDAGSRPYVRLVFEHVGVIRLPVYVHLRPKQTGTPARSLRVELLRSSRECGGSARVALGP